MKKTDEDKHALLLRNSQVSMEDGTATSFTRDDSLSAKLADSVKEAEKDFDIALLSLAMVEGHAKEQVISGLPYIRSQVSLALKKVLEKMEKEWEGKEEKLGSTNFALRVVNLKIVLAEYRNILERINITVANYTGRGIAEFKGLINIAKEEGLDFTHELLASLEEKDVAEVTQGRGKSSNSIVKGSNKDDEVDAIKPKPPKSPKPPKPPKPPKSPKPPKPPKPPKLLKDATEESKELKNSTNPLVLKSSKTNEEEVEMVDIKPMSNSNDDDDNDLQVNEQSLDKNI
ncbi:hypothetical protein TrST_g13685 [Triparma strigata]|uniref:Uncharacterized protein n=1 Tax=Triparma strigata TaxID=1606541 RepID=A0A9W7BX01_9STRA|nr:hypothetical protein TrST_g13685 [Triparma strigata]